MKQTTACLLVLMLILTTSGARAALPAREPVLCIDPDVEEPLDLRNFRTVLEAPGRKECRTCSIEGLLDLRTSGSSEFSERVLGGMLARIPSRQVVVVDLRQEAHGFVNGMPVAWRGPHNAANKGKSREAVFRDEARRLEELRHTPSLTLMRRSGDHKRMEPWRSVDSPQVRSEEQLCRAAGVGYVRFPVTDGEGPTPDEVDRFVEYVRTMPAGTWLHFHCLAGIGRTTLFMAMLDMMRNARRVSLDDIITRQLALGGISPFRKAGRPEIERIRAATVRRFYEYCRSNQDGFRTPWSTWIGQRPLPVTPGLPPAER